MTCAEPGCDEFPLLRGLCGWCYRRKTGRCPTCTKWAGRCAAYATKGK